MATRVACSWRLVMWDPEAVELGDTGFCSEEDQRWDWRTPSSDHAFAGLLMQMGARAHAMWSKRVEPNSIDQGNRSVLRSD